MWSRILWQLGKYFCLGGGGVIQIRNCTTRIIQQQLSHVNNLEEATCPEYCARVPTFTAIVVYPIDHCPWLGQLKFLRGRVFYQLFEKPGHSRAIKSERGSFGTQDRPNIDRRTSLAALTCRLHTTALSEHNKQAKSEPAIDTTSDLIITRGHVTAVKYTLFPNATGLASVCQGQLWCFPNAIVPTNPHIFQPFFIHYL